MKSTRKRMRVTDLNPNLTCMLCGGYFIDATTLTECLHSFCKSCIVKHLKTNKNCPVCNVMVHKTKPHINIRSDKTLQDLVYKLVPGLYKIEMKRRRYYYSQHPHEAPSKVGEERGDENAERILYSEDDKFSLALHFCDQGVKDERSVRTLTLPEVGASITEVPKNVRYLQCPAGVTMDILKKFVRIKYELPHKYQIDIFHSDKALRDDFTLMDVAYLYTWRRKEPLKLHFSVYEFIMKRRKMVCTGTTKRLLDPSNLLKREAKNPTASSDNTKSESKSDTAKPGTESDKSGGAGGDKLARQGDKGEQEKAAEDKDGGDIVKEETSMEQLSAEDTKTPEAMDTSVAMDQPCVDKKLVKVDVAEAASGLGQENASRVKTEKKAAEKVSIKRDAAAVNNTVAGEQDKKAVMKTVVGSAIQAVTTSPSSASALTTTTTTSTTTNSPSKATTSNASTLTSYKVLTCRNSPKSPASTSPLKRKSSDSTIPAGSIAKQIANMSKKTATTKTSAGGDPHPVAVSGSSQTAVTGAGRSQPSLASAGGSATQGDKPQGLVSDEAPRAGASAESASTGRKSAGVCPQPSSSRAPLSLTPSLADPATNRAAATAVRSSGTSSRSVASSERSAVQVPRSSVAAYVGKTTCSSPSPAKPKPAVAAAPARAHVPSSPVSSSNNNNSTTSIVVPSAAAGAAGAASPSPAALAASSSPSPPMAGSAASVKDSMEQALKLPIVTGPPRPDASSLATSAAVKPAVTSLAAFKPTQSSVGVPSSLSSAAPVVATTGSIVAATLDAKAPVVLKKPSPSSDMAKNLSDLEQQAVPLSREDKNRRPSPPSLSVSTKEVTEGHTCDSGSSKQTGSNDKNKVCVNGDTKSDKNTDSLTKQAKDSGARGNKNIITTTSNNQRVVMPGRPSIASLAAGVPTLLSGRNGMPTVVTKPTRGVSNAATSVNTLLHHKLPALSSPSSSAGPAQRAAPAVGALKTNDTTSAASTPTSSVSARPCATASPVYKQQPSRPVASPESASVSRPSPAHTAKTPAHTVKESVPRPCAPATPSAALSKQQQQQQQLNRRRGLAAPTMSVPPSSRPVGSTSTPSSSSSSSSSSSLSVAIQPSSARASSGNSSCSAASTSAAASSAPLLIQPTRPSGGTSTPVPIQPLPLAGSPSLVAAMRRGLANEMQQSFQQVFAQHAKQQQQQQQHHQQQHHQQQLLEFQQLQLLQQQQLYNIHAAAAAMARYNQMQAVAGLASPTYLAAAAAVNPASVSVASPVQIQPVPTTDNTKKQTAPETTPPQKKQGQAFSGSSGGSGNASRKSGEMPSASSSSPKKKITDIANSLHKKVSQQTMGGGTSSTTSSAAAKSSSSCASSSSTAGAVATSSADKHPPNAHTPTGPKVSGGGSKGEEEPLNLVVARNGTCNGADVPAASTPASAVKLVGEKSS